MNTTVSSFAGKPSNAAIVMKTTATDMEIDERGKRKRGNQEKGANVGENSADKKEGEEGKCTRSRLLPKEK